MKIAVTGASGFLGRHVATELVGRGHTPVLATRDPTTMTSFIPQMKVVRLDHHAPPADPFTTLGCPDLVIHLAWQGLPHYQSLKHIENELPAQIHFLESLVAAGLRKLAVTGTCLEYGTTSGRKSEPMLADPSTPYAVAKDTLRRYLQDLQSKQPFDLNWHRLFYLYGSGQSEQSLLPQLRRATATGSNFKMSPGDQIRDFHPVTTAASEIVTLALTEGACGIVNGCSGQPISVRGFVERYLAESGISIPIELGYYPYTTYEPFAFWGDVSYLKQCLKHSP